MINYLSNGDVQDFVAPSGGVTSGVPVQIGKVLCVPQASAAQGATFAGLVRGLVSGVAKLSTDDMSTDGTKVYWDSGNSRLTVTATSNLFVGYSRNVTGGDPAAAASTTVVTVYLHGAPT